MLGRKVKQWGQPYQNTSKTSILSGVSVGCGGVISSYLPLGSIPAPWAVMAGSIAADTSNARGTKMDEIRFILGLSTYSAA